MADVGDGPPDIVNGATHVVDGFGKGWDGCGCDVADGAAVAVVALSDGVNRQLQPFHRGVDVRMQALDGCRNLVPYDVGHSDRDRCCNGAGKFVLDECSDGARHGRWERSINGRREVVLGDESGNSIKKCFIWAPVVL